MTTDLRIFTRDAPDGLPSPVWEAVNAAIRGLDGDSRSEVALGRDAMTSLIVVGGPERFVVWAQRWDDNLLIIDTASDPSPPLGSMSVTLENGQVDDIALADTVDLATTLRAARTYLESQTLDPGIAWDHQGPPPKGD